MLRAYLVFRSGHDPKIKILNLNFDWICDWIVKVLTFHRWNRKSLDGNTLKYGRILFELPLGMPDVSDRGCNDVYREETLWKASTPTQFNHDMETWRVFKFSNDLILLQSKDVRQTQFPNVCWRTCASLNNCLLFQGLKVTTSLTQFHTAVKMFDNN